MGQAPPATLLDPPRYRYPPSSTFSTGTRRRFLCLSNGRDPTPAAPPDSTGAGTRQGSARSSAENTSVTTCASSASRATAPPAPWVWESPAPPTARSRCGPRRPVCGARRVLCLDDLWTCDQKSRRGECRASQGREAFCVAQQRATGTGTRAAQLTRGRRGRARSRARAFSSRSSRPSHPSTFQRSPRTSSQARQPPSPRRGPRRGPRDVHEDWR
jgi:hypothetical protein